MAQWRAEEKPREELEGAGRVAGCSGGAEGAGGVIKVGKTDDNLCIIVYVAGDKVGTIKGLKGR